MAGPSYKHILVVVDGTESSLKAAEVAVELARLMQSRLTALGVVDTEILRKLASVHILVDQEMQEFEDQLQSNQTRHLEYVLELARNVNVPAEMILRKGACHSAVMTEQRQRKCDLVVIGAFRSTLTKIDVVSRERQLVLDEVPCPVLIVR